ncbi:DUF2079 domain-containing protein [Mariniluteicoccus endophyticus]
MRLRRALLTQPRSAWVVALAAFFAYTLLGWQQWRRFQSPSWDLAIFTQVLQGYAKLQLPVVDVKGAGYQIWGDHFHPLLAVLAPAYALFPSAFTLLVLQAGLLALSAFFIAKTAHEHLGRGSGWALGMAYAFCWGVQQAAAVQFHEVALGAPILAIALWALMRENWLTAGIWASLLVFVKEDLPLTVAAFGVVLAWRSRRWLIGGILVVWGVFMVWLAMKVVLPAFNPEGKYDYGKNISLGDILADPFGIAHQIFTNEKKMSTLLLLCVCVMFTLLRSELALVAVPTLAWRFLSANEGHWGPTWHYSLMLMPVAYAAAVDGCARLRRSRFWALRGWGLHGSAMALAVSIALLNQMPLRDLRPGEKWELGSRQAAAAAAVDLVPHRALVAADVSLMNQLVGDRDLYYIGQKGNPVAEWLVIDNVAGGWNQQVDIATYGGQIYPGTKWETVFDAEGYQVARRR